MSAVLVRVGKAHPIRKSEDVPNVVIEIGPSPIDLDGTPAEIRMRFQEDAKKIVDGMSLNLPGGTMDQVLRLLLERKASQLVVRI